MSYKVSGKIISISEIETLKSGAKKLVFEIDTEEKYNNLYSFQIYKGQVFADQVNNFVKYNNVGDLVTVEFNISCNEYNGKYYTNLNAWRTDKIDSMPQVQEVTASDFAPDREDLPF